MSSIVKCKMCGREYDSTNGIGCFMCDRTAYDLESPFEQQPDGLGGTDNVEPLFKDRPTAAGLPPQPEVIQILEELLLQASTGKITGIIFTAFDGLGSHRSLLIGKVPLDEAICSLEQHKFAILADDFGKRLQQMTGPKK